MASRSLAALGAIVATNAMTSIAQNMSFGAANFYVSDNVTVAPITFPNQFREMVAGNLFVPKDFDSTTKASAIVVGPPFGAAKEQSANLYATKLAEQGFITISIDPGYWGPVDGQPRNSVLPDMFAESFSGAVDYLTLQDYVDHERIGVLGICGSGSWAVSATKLDTRIKALATVSMYDMGAASRDGMENAIGLEQRQAMIEGDTRWRQSRVDNPETAFAAGFGRPPLNENSTDVDREFFDFYQTPRAEYPPVGSTLNLTRPALSMNRFMNYWPLSGLDVVQGRPVMFVAGTQAHSREFSVDAYNLAAHPKELVWVQDAGHVDLYDRTELIPFHTLATFFQNGLSAANVTVAHRR
ncbi:hydrolase of the alpha/beta superfamily [Boeremia exigua]|uniref:hydrolase of the alpha/beta superfamily n=1 Tax=Boeremia exigua TaxID=749465 RepID=UPI001E8E4440|nr:hydrolase of the alpha/beta superfamily [Boeremia exigua]KAH6619059.1 hydrolase of the alpha/beta superfamily [Boeremia exigua]